MDKEKYTKLKKQQYLKDRHITDKCSNCGKDLMKKDADYSQYMFTDVYCLKHIPDTNRWGKLTITLKGYETEPSITERTGEMVM